MGRPGPPRDLCTATWKWFREQPSLRGLHGGSVSTSPVDGERKARAAGRVYCFYFMSLRTRSWEEEPRERKCSRED